MVLHVIKLSPNYFLLTDYCSLSGFFTILPKQIFFHHFAKTNQNKGTPAKVLHAVSPLKTQNFHNTLQVNNSHFEVWYGL